VRARRAEQVPQVVIQTGDVSTFGALVSSDDVNFPEWQYWRNQVRKKFEPRTKAWIDLFGNHDVWPGTLPILEAPCIERVVQALRDQFFPKMMPIPYRIELETFALELYAVNSVLTGPIDNTRAIGGLPPEASQIRPSFSVYELCDVGDKIELKRIVYEHPSKLAYKFVATAADTFDVSAPSPIPRSA
jgi:hypothetical protein